MGKQNCSHRRHGKARCLSHLYYLICLRKIFRTSAKRLTFCYKSNRDFLIAVFSDASSISEKEEGFGGWYDPQRALFMFKSYISFLGKEPSLFSVSKLLWKVALHAFSLVFKNACCCYLKVEWFNVTWGLFVLQVSFNPEPLPKCYSLLIPPFLFCKVIYLHEDL